MANSKELQAQIDEQDEMISEALEVLQDSYRPEASRADLVEAVSEAIDILSGEVLPEEEEGDETQGK